MSTKWSQLPREELQQLVIDAVQTSPSMRIAAFQLKMNYQTFRKWAKRFNVWKTNIGGKGTRKRSMSHISLHEILEGKHPSYGYGNLKMRLLKTGIKKNECEECGISSWRGKPITIQMDHYNGNRYDHRLENLRMLCPNCHSQTETWCGRNNQFSVISKYDDCAHKANHARESSSMKPTGEVGVS